ncbi:MAG: diaminopimelate epimerase [Bacteroidota bacterium]|nr:diaminopimelate epimerase [Bacteroidota bacterium]
MHFVKYQGTGNDFILIDNRKRLFDHLDVKSLCHPKFGIGADGLMLLQEIAGFDFEMVYYNSDGNISSMCGNGGRCIVDFAKSLGVFKNESTHFKAIDGPHDAIWDNHYVELKMIDVEKVENENNHFVLNTGSPHYVKFVTHIDGLDIIQEAHSIRYSDRFKDEGINVNFVEVIDQQTIKVRTYERGVENQTLSCGTGVTACALSFSVFSKLGNSKNEVHILTPGGNLKVKFTKEAKYTDIWLCGPATKVYEGNIELA